jgi:hypothetical protein
MRCRVAIANRSVTCARNDNGIQDDYCPDRNLATVSGRARLIQRRIHKF